MGQAPLWKVFLFGGPLVGAFLPFVLAVVFPAWPPWSSYVAVAVASIYGVWICVALWRCAYNVQVTVWGHLARLYVIAAIVVVATNFLR